MSNMISTTFVEKISFSGFVEHLIIVLKLRWRTAWKLELCFAETLVARAITGCFFNWYSYKMSIKYWKNRKLFFHSTYILMYCLFSYFLEFSKKKKLMICIHKKKSRRTANPNLPVQISSSGILYLKRERWIRSLCDKHHYIMICHFSGCPGLIIS